MRRLTAFGVDWEPGPQVMGTTGRHYRGDIALLDQRIAIEVCSHHEISKPSLDRLIAFQREGWTLRTIHSAPDIDHLLRGIVR